MNPTKSILAGLTLLLAVPLASAQEDHEVAKPKKVAKVVSAAAQASATFTVPVTGMTADNAADVRASLGELRDVAYVCTSCKAAGAHPGTCSKCEQPLRAEKFTVIQSFDPAKDHTKIALTLEPGRTVRLSALESALEGQGVEVDRSKLILAGEVTLEFEGAADEDAEEALAKALRGQDLFKTAKASRPDHGHTLEVHAKGGSTGPTFDAVAKAATKSAAGLRLSDVLWTARPKA